MARKAGATKARKPKKARSKKGGGRAQTKRKPKAQARKTGTDFLDERLSKALGHGMRVNIMAVVSWRMIAPSEFARETGESLSKVSYHFKKLVAYDVIELTKTERVRGVIKHYYRGTRQAIFGGAGWADLPKSVQDGVAGAALQDLTKVGVRAIESGTFSARDDSYLVWEPLTYDEPAIEAAIKILESTRQRLNVLQDISTTRRAETGGEGILMAIALAGFEMAPG